MPRRFEERAQVMVNFFDSIQVFAGDSMPTVRLTLGENIADHGGFAGFLSRRSRMRQKMLPCRLKDGFTPEQRFFLSYAGCVGRQHPS